MHNTHAKVHVSIVNGEGKNIGSILRDKYELVTIATRKIDVV